MPVDQLECRRCESVFGDRSYRVPSVDGGVEVSDDGALRFLQRAQLHCDLGDDTEGALGADHQPGEVVAGNTLGCAAAKPYELAGAGDDLYAEDVVPGDAVLDAAQAAGVGGDVAADGGPGCAGRIRRVPEAFLGAGSAEVVVDDARFDDGEAFEGVDLLDGVHLVEGDDDTTVDGVGTAGQSGARAATDNGDASHDAGPNDGLHLLGGAWPDDE